MMDRKKFTLPFSDEEILSLNSGDLILISGEILIARDAAHKRMVETLKEGGELSFNIKGEAVYYAGPTPEKEGQVIGSCGPTTSGRMDKYSPYLMERGLKVMIGKGERSDGVIEKIKELGGVYLGAIGGAGALISKCITEAKIVAYEDLGAEAVRRVKVEELPLTVVIDSKGNNLYKR